MKFFNRFFQTFTALSFFLVGTLTSTAHAASTNTVYTAALVIIENSKTVAQPTIKLTEKKATKTVQTLKLGKLEIEILPVLGVMNGKNGIILSFQVRKIDKTGKKSLLSEPGVLAQVGETVTVDIGPEGKEKAAQVMVTLSN